MEGGMTNHIIGRAIISSLLNLDLCTTYGLQVKAELVVPRTTLGLSDFLNSETQLRAQTESPLSVVALSEEGQN